MLENKISELNKQAWNLRYADRDEAMRFAVEAKEAAIKDLDQTGLNYSRLTIAQLDFWKMAETGYLKEAIEALLFFEKINEPLGISRAHCICAGIFDQYGQYEKAMHHAQHAVKISRQVDDNDNKADCYTVLGQIYSRIHDYSQAIEALRQGLETRKQLKDEKAVASSLNLIGRNFVLSKKFEAAAVYYQESLLLREKTGDVGGIPWTYLGLASLYSEKGELETALNYFDKAESTNELKEKRFELLCLLGRGKIYLEQSKITEAIEYLNKALEFAETLKIISLTSEVHQLLSVAYEKSNDLSKALLHYKCFNDLQQQILSSEKVNMLKHQQIAFSVESAEKEAEIHRLKNVELKNAFDKINSQHLELEIKNKEITDSIDYAKYIQDAYFPSKDLFHKIVPDSFILYKPKDIVSGDFYWFYSPYLALSDREGVAHSRTSEQKDIEDGNTPPLGELEGVFLFAAADCTGHGVPGAIMSVICCNALNDVVKKHIIHQPDLILNEVRKIVTGAFEHYGNSTSRQDGMDISLVSLDLSGPGTLRYAGANNPLWIVRKGKPANDSKNNMANENYHLIEIKANKQPIGIYERMDPFTLHEMDVFKGDTIYSFSDGYADQFGLSAEEWAKADEASTTNPLELNAKKFKYKPLKELILSIQDNTMAEQQIILARAFEDWKGGLEQVDDVIIIGVRI